MQRRALILFTLLFATLTVFAQGNVRNDSIRRSLRERNKSAKSRKEVVTDTLPTRYPVAKTSPNTLDDMKELAADLKTPTNIVTDTLYNENDSTYQVSTRVGNTILGTPILLTPQEYAKWQERATMSSFFKRKNLLNVICLLGKLGVCATALADSYIAHICKEGMVNTEKLTVTASASDDSAKNVSSAFI